MNGKSTLIFTDDADIHAFAVERVLSILGGNPVIFETRKMPSGEPLSVSYRESQTDLRLGKFEGSLEDVRSTWNRRFTRLFQMPADIHPADFNFIRASSQGVLAGVLCLLDNRFPVNPIAAARTHSNKLMQLRVARDAGLRVPKTLVSNNYGDIQSFMSSVDELCMKPFNPHGWLTDSGPLQSLNVRLNKDCGFDRRSFEISPAIYQEFINKRAEYRVVLFGGFASCSRIDCEALSGQSVVDWRSSPHYLSTLTPCELPEAVLGALRKVMAKLGLRFGAIDLAETVEGEYVFFEVNEQGQWLWQELHCAETRILQPFCEYLLQADDGFRWDPSRLSDELSAEHICAELESDPRFAEEAAADPAQSAFTSDEREAAIT